MMKKLIYILIISLCAFLMPYESVSQVTAIQPTSQQQTYYKELGTFQYVITPTTKIQTRFYVTKEINRDGVYNEFYYKYVLVGVSQSTNNGVLTSTWFYDNRISINGQEKNFFSTLYVRTTPTQVYFWYSNDANVNFGITWNNCTYDPRNLK